MRVHKAPNYIGLRLALLQITATPTASSTVNCSQHDDVDSQNGSNVSD